MFIDGPHSAAGAFPDSDRAAADADEDGDAIDSVGPRAWWLVGENIAAAASAAAAAALLERVTLDGAAVAAPAPAAVTSLPTVTTDGEAPSEASPAPAPTWVRPALSREMRGWEETAALITEVVASEGPFDGVLAFSQGASTSALALALIPQLADTVRFAVLVGGFQPMDPGMAAKLNTRGGGGGAPGSKMKVRSLHVHGVNDAMVSRARAEELMSSFEDAELFEHGGGHGVPTGADFRARLKAFILAE